MPELVINGQMRQYNQDSFPQTVLSLLQQHNLAPDSIIVEVDGQIVAATEFAHRALKPTSKIELVRYVGGG